MNETGPIGELPRLLSTEDSEGGKNSRRAFQERRNLKLFRTTIVFPGPPNRAGYHPVDRALKASIPADGDRLPWLHSHYVNERVQQAAPATTVLVVYYYFEALVKAKES